MRALQVGVVMLGIWAPANSSGQAGGYDESGNDNRAEIFSASSAGRMSAPDTGLTAPATSNGIEEIRVKTAARNWSWQ